MAGETVVFFVKYTTLVAGTYYSDPYEVTGYKTITAETFFAAGFTAATVTAQMEQSSDLISWTNFGTSMAPAAGNVASEIEPDPARYVRLRVTIGGGTDKVATIWAKAVARDA